MLYKRFLVLLFVTMMMSFLPTLSVDAQILGKCVPWCPGDFPGGGGGGSDDPPSYSLLVKNETPFRVCVAVEYLENPDRTPSGSSRLAFVRSRDWVSRGWYCADSGESVTALRGVENAFVYWYATGTGRYSGTIWSPSGSDESSGFYINTSDAFFFDPQKHSSPQTAYEICSQDRDCDTDDLSYVSGKLKDLRQGQSITLTYNN